MTDQISMTALAERSLPLPRVIDGGLTNERIDGYGHCYINSLWPTKHILADEGSYFVATNPVPATAITFAINATYDVTKNLFVFQNFDVFGGRRMYMDYIKLICTTAPASATAAYYALAIDNIVRYTSGGTLIGPNGAYTAKNVNGDNATQSIGGVYYGTAGVITSPAASTFARIVARGAMRSVIPAVGDEMVLAFGSADPSGGSSATAAGRTVSSCPPIIIGPQQNLIATVWFPSNASTALQYEFEIGWAER